MSVITTNNMGFLEKKASEIMVTKILSFMARRLMCLVYDYVPLRQLMIYLFKTIT